MKCWLRYLILLIGTSSYLLGADEGYQFEALKAWIATKRQVTIKERGGSLSLSGDVRTEYLTSNEQENGLKNIGTQSQHPLIAADQFKLTFGLLLDYRADATWASIKLRFGNSMGIESGTNNKLNLERAFIGFRIVDTEKFTVDMEPGRRKLVYTFDSRMEFNAIMDGLLIKYDQSSDRMGDFYIHAAAFIVDERINQFAYAMETGILNIYNTGVYVKYSLIDWYTKHFNNSVRNAKFEYFVNQIMLGYRFVFPGTNKVSVFYSAYLLNSAAPKREILKEDKANNAAYIGFTMGEVRKKGDWAIDTNIQYCQPQAIPGFDFGGIGAGNSDIVLGMNRTNYIGGLFEFAYLITDNLTIVQAFKCSKSLDYLEDRYSMKQYRLEFAYAW